MISSDFPCTISGISGNVKCFSWGGGGFDVENTILKKNAPSEKSPD